VENYEKKLKEVNEENKVLKTSVRALEENFSLLSDSYNDLEQ
jgi:predicted nuclease with TOPRIM domain